MKTFIALILITACTKTQIVQAPTTPVKPATNHAADLVELVTPFKAQGVKCRPWTGAGTAFPGLDSYLCETPTSLTWCVAPTDGAPRCMTSVDWTPPRTPVEQSKQEAAKPTVKK